LARPALAYRVGTFSTNATQASPGEAPSGDNQTEESGQSD